MQQYFVAVKDLTVGERVQLSQVDSHHFLKVMRAQTKEQVTVVSEAGVSYLAELVAIIEDNAELQIIQLEKVELHSVELPVHVTIACGLSKNDKVETIVQKATECGMAEFMPLSLKRDVVKWIGKKADAKIERLSKIAKGAAEQSHRLIVPQIANLHNLEQLIHQSASFDIKLIAFEENAKSGHHSQLARVFKQLQGHERILVVFGSEGGLELKEVERLEEAGFISCSLGPRILRAETAPIYFLSALSFSLELDKV